MSEPKDSVKNKVLYLFLPGLLGWGAGVTFLFIEVSLLAKGITLLSIAPFFLGLIERIDKKSYFPNNFRNASAMSKVVYIWNAGVIAVFLAHSGGSPGQ